MRIILFVFGSVSTVGFGLISKPDAILLDALPDTDTLDLLTDWLPELMPANFSSRVIQPPSGSELRKQAKNGELYWLIGTHHKTGTHLGRWFAKYQAEALGLPLDDEWWPKCRKNATDYDVGLSRTFVLCHLSGEGVKNITDKVASKGGRLKVAHFVREPVNWVISSYLYHSRQREDWGQIGTHPWVDYSKMTMEEGLETEAKWVLANEVADALRANAAMGAGAMLVRLEDLTQSSSSFDETMRRWFSYMLDGLQPPNPGLVSQLTAKAADQDLRRNIATVMRNDPGHVTSEELKELAKKAADRIPKSVLNELMSAGNALGYSYSRLR